MPESLFLSLPLPGVVRRLAVALVVSLVACATPPPTPSPTPPRADDGAALRATLAYYAASPRPEAGRDRGDPQHLMQQAIQAGQARVPDLPRAISLLETVLRSQHPAAATQAPLARLLHDQYGERLRLDQQWRDAQKRGDQLQEKLDALSAIERSLPARSLPPRQSPRPGATP